MNKESPRRNWNSDMPTREELDAKIDTVRALTDGHYHELCARMNALDTRMNTLEVRMDKLEIRMEKLEVRMEHLEHDMVELKRSVWVANAATVVSVIAIVMSSYFATQSANRELLQSTLAAIEAGRASVPAAPTP
jgi:predicted nuclease with TOPRIM domain